MSLTGEEVFEVHRLNTGERYLVKLKCASVDELLLIANSVNTHALKMALYSYQFRRRQREIARKNSGPRIVIDDNDAA